MQDHRRLVAYLAASLLAACGIGTSHAAPVRLNAGTHLTLELMHHITSSETPSGSTVYFRVRDDTLAQGQVVIRKGTIVTGRMESTTDRGAVGVSGSLNFGVRYVPAIDGQNVRVLASMSSNGRSRDNALIGWSIFWGLPGLLTHGVNAFARRGAELDAEVLSDKLISIEDAAMPAAGAAPPPSLQFAIEQHLLGTVRNRTVELNLEKVRDLPVLTFKGKLENPIGAAVPVKSAQLVAVNGQSIAESVVATKSAADDFGFNAWAVAKYCDDGTNNLEFRVTMGDGQTAVAHYALPVAIKVKGRQ